MAKKIYECGTLRYSLGGLLLAVGLILFAFFSFTLTTSIVNTLIPLQLKSVLGADNKTITLITGTIAGIFNITVCPIVSFKSDRYRSKWGRRIPFILWTMIPYISSILFFAFSVEISALLRKISWISGAAPATVTVIIIAVIMIFYQFFYMFVGSVIYYLYNDVIPVEFQARVVGAVRVSCTVATTLFNLLLLKYSLEYFKLLLTGAAVIYVSGVGLMCFLLKEPEYPEPDTVQAEKSKNSAGMLTFIKESFSHRFYWFSFIFTSLMSVSGIGIFLIFFNQDMGLSLDEIGKLFGIKGIISTVLSMLCATTGTLLIDRWHPVRVCLFGVILLLLEPLFFLKFIFATPPPQVFLWSNLLSALFLGISGIVYNFSSMPMLMRIYPKSRFGQFCSASAMLRSIMVLAFSLILGACIDLLKYNAGLGDFAYRYIWVWRLGWMLLAILFFILLYREWLKLGGDRFRAPAPWSPEGSEEMPIAEISYPTGKTVTPGMKCLGGVVIMHLLMTLTLSWIVFKCCDGKYFIAAAIPLAALVLFYFLRLYRSVKNDLKKVRAGETPDCGIPHHGLLFIIAFVAAGMSITGFYQAFSVRDGQWAAAWFWCPESLILMLMLFAVELTARLERKYTLIKVEKQ